MSLSLIKTRIKTNLDSLVTAGVLSSAAISDLKLNPLGGEIPSYPHAVVMPPAVQSDVLDNRSNLRTYTFDIVVLFRGEDLTGTTELEEKIEAILNIFDNDPTLDGNAIGGVLPVSSAPQPFEFSGGTVIMVVIELQAKDHVSLTFP